MLVLGTVALALRLVAAGWAGDAPEPAHRPWIASSPWGFTAKQKARAGSPSAAYRTFQVPAGTPLPIELRTALVSDRSHPQDYVRGRLREAIVLDGVELVPAGAPILGSVIQAAPAPNTRDRGQLAFRFNVIEHPETGSRVSIRTELLAYEGTRVDAKRAKNGENEVRLAIGETFSASTLEPFLVFIPRTPK
jgi:hypothetical protein